MFSYYDVLGVDPSDDHETIKSAYRRKARQFHPDRLVHADPELAAEVEDHMRALNEAWSVLGDPDARARYDREIVGPGETSPDFDPYGGYGWSPGHLRTPGPNDCVMCGSSPATLVKIRQVTGLVLARNERILQETLCRGCGMSAVREMTNRTLWTGWWGITAFFINFAALFDNFNAYRELSRLGQPRRNDDVAAPMPFPIPPGRPLLQRSGVWFAILFVGFGLIGVVAEAVDSSSPSPAARTESVTPSPQDTVVWRDGRCVTIYENDQVEPHLTSCETANAVVVSVVDNPASCPFPDMYGWVTRDDGRHACLGPRLGR